MITQGTPEWFALRCSRLTASAFPDLMAKTKSGPSASRANLIAKIAVERLTGKPTEGYSNAYMQRGIELEPIARSAYEAHVGMLTEECGFFVHPHFDYVGASPDGLVGNQGLLEIKCLTMAKHVECLRKGAHAAEYRWQVQGQLWVTGRQWCDVVAFHPDFPEGLQLAIKRVERNEADIAELAEECHKAQAEICAMVSELQQMRAAI